MLREAKRPYGQPGGTENRCSEGERTQDHDSLCTKTPYFLNLVDQYQEKASFHEVGEKELGTLQ